MASVNEGAPLVGLGGVEEVATKRAADEAMAEEAGAPGGLGVRGVPCGAPRGAGGAGTGKTTLTPRADPVAEDWSAEWRRCLASSRVPPSPSTTGRTDANPSKFLSSAS